jgi:hypothetical protein
MKLLVLLVISAGLVACNSAAPQTSKVDWMPDSLKWESNIADCRAQAQCNAADLFDRF